MRIPRRDFLRVGLAAAACGAGGPIWARQGLRPRDDGSSQDSGWAQLPGILAKIVPPQFPARDFLITSYGAPSNGVSNSAPAIKAAINACNRAGGGRVVVPAGEWFSKGPIRLLSNVNLYVEEGATITFGTEPQDYLPVQLVRWQGIRCYNYSPLIYAYGQQNIAITGSGVLDGKAYPSWSKWADKQMPDFNLLRQMAEMSVPLSGRVFGAGHYLRPGFFEPYYCSNILVQGVTFQGSPFWTMHPTFCTNVTLEEVTVNPGAQNDDGCDPDSCQYVLVAGCNFNTVDDNVSIKAGLLPDAQGLPACENIVIQGCNCLRSDFSGLTMGTDLGGFIRDVFIEDCTVNDCINAHYIKAHENWAGGIENVYIRNNQVFKAQNLFTLQPDAYNEAGPLGPPSYSNINMENVTCADSIDVPFQMIGDPRLPIDGVNLANISVQSKTAIKVDRIENTVNLTASGIVYNGLPVTIVA